MLSKNQVLVIDDDIYIQTAISELLEDNNISTVCYSDYNDAINYIKENNDLQTVISDIKLKSATGIKLLKEIKAFNPELPVILITAFSDINIVIEALREGAYDFIKKPFENAYLLSCVNRALERYILISQNKTLSIDIKEKNEKIKSLEKIVNEIVDEEHIFCRMVGKSDKMKVIFQLIRDAANTDANVLITGESGTGKELVAKALHENSNRKDKPFVPINCGALPENLIESELFGYEAGAFTGANKKKIGKFEFADTGTIFLDEIGELSINLQVKLLRVLQDRYISPLGSNKLIKTDVRIVAATNQNLFELIKSGKFREDLFYRLNVIPIFMPSLKDRVEDIIMLSMYFINRFNLRYNKNIKTISESLYNHLITNSWPGNIRELENFIERLVVLAKSDILEYKDVIFDSQNSDPNIKQYYSKDSSLKYNLEKFEKVFIQDSLKKHKSNIQKTSLELGIDVKTLYRKMKKYHIDKSKM